MTPPATLSSWFNSSLDDVVVLSFFGFLPFFLTFTNYCEISLSLFQGFLQSSPRKFHAIILIFPYA